jgi:hypothetical protein
MRLGYYMRYIVTEERTLDLRILEHALHEQDSAYRLENLQFEPYEAADLGYGDEVYAEIEINRRGDDLFADEVEILLDELDNWEFELDEDRTVQAALRQMVEGARVIVAVRVLFGDNGLEDGIRLLETLWRWMFDAYDGVLQVDYEGYYDGEGLLLALEEEA